MLTQILYTSRNDLAAVIGGKLPCIHGSGLSGNSGVMVCEACEFADSFLDLHPDIAIILNVDEDHLDYFKTLDNIIKSFTVFAEKTSRTIIYNGDCENTKKVISKITDKKIISFGKTSNSDYSPADIISNGLTSSFTLMHKSEKLCNITVGVPGYHNVFNAVAATIAAIELGVETEHIQKGLTDFKGALRRFEHIGTAKGITIVDDYAHHPAELEVTLKTAKTLGYKRVWAVFQPFTYSRTALLLDGFAQSLALADVVILTHIFGGRERNTYNIFSHDLATKLDNCVLFDENFSESPNEQTPAEKEQNFKDVAEYICNNAKDGDLVITLGCGDAYKIAKDVYSRLK
jgi:UDP-N-acetylmuramate--alanine ligase